MHSAARVDGLPRLARRLPRTLLACPTASTLSLVQTDPLIMATVRHSGTAKGAKGVELSCVRMLVARTASRELCANAAAAKMMTMI